MEGCQDRNPDIENSLSVPRGAVWKQSGNSHYEILWLFFSSIVEEQLQMDSKIHSFHIFQVLIRLKLLTHKIIEFVDWEMMWSFSLLKAHPILDYYKMKELSKS